MSPAEAKSRERGRRLVVEERHPGILVVPERRSSYDPDMRLVRLLPAVFVLAVFVSGTATAAPAGDGFKLIHVNDLVALRAAPNAAVTVLDANAPDFRAREGVIPGAVLLSSDNKYDVAKELPPRKDARLVFYCANIH